MNFLKLSSNLLDLYKGISLLKIGNKVSCFLPSLNSMQKCRVIKLSTKLKSGFEFLKMGFIGVESEFVT